MYFYLNIEQQIKRIMRKINFKDFSQSSEAASSNELKDICDGKVYRRLLDSDEGESFKKKESLTFLINTDGASICKKSSLTLWPVYLVINELPIHIRFSLENVILAGNYIGVVPKSKYGNRLIQ